MSTVSDGPEAFVTGVGLLTPLGRSAWSTWRALLDGRLITDRCSDLQDPIAPFDLARAVGCVSPSHGALDPAIELAEAAARQAMAEADRSPRGQPTVVACSKGAVHDPRVMPRGPVALVGDALRDRLRLGPIRPIAAACASSLIGVHLARQWLSEPGIDRVLVVSSEAALLPVFVHSYQRLGVLAPVTRQAYRGRPLDRQRAGFVLTEVGAAVLLERQSRRPLARLLDTAAGCESGDLIRASAGSGRPALGHVAAELLREPIDLLHPHATGTLDNDSTELAEYERQGQPIRDVYACKGALGHGLGASGLTAMVLAVLAGRSSRRPPMPWLTAPIESDVLLAARRRSDRGVDRQAVFAAGFGGHVAGVLLGRA